MVYIFSHEHLSEQFWTILEECDPECRLYAYRIENDRAIRPALLKTGPKPSLLEDLREAFGAGDFQIMVRRGKKMLLAGRIGIAPRVDRR